MSGSTNVALAPTRRSEFTRAPSMRMRVRPLDRPRSAGTAACPSLTWFTPGTFSSACTRLDGIRVWISACDTLVVADAGVASMSGAAPETVRRSLTSASTVMVSGSSPAGSASTSRGFMNMPPGATTRISNGSGGSGVQVKWPPASVTTEPGWPRMLTSAPATGVPSGPTTRPVSARAGATPSSHATTSRRTGTRMLVQPNQAATLLPAFVLSRCVAGLGQRPNATTNSAAW